MMQETPAAPDVVTGQPEPKKSNVGIIIAVVAVVLCCCCVIFLGLGYAFGDQVMEAIQQVR